MSKYNGCYVKVLDNPAYWAVDDGKRRLISGVQEMYAVGLRRVVVLTAEGLEAIPLEGGGTDEILGGEGDPVEHSAGSGPS